MSYPEVSHILPNDFKKTIVFFYYCQKINQTLKHWDYLNINLLWHLHGMAVYVSTVSASNWKWKVDYLHFHNTAVTSHLHSSKIRIL